MFIFKSTQKRANPYTPYTDEDGVQYPRIPAELLEEIPDPTPPEDFSDETYFRTEQDDAPYIIYTKKPQEMLDAMLFAKAKLARHQAVAEIVVTTSNGNSFDGDEDSQNRMSRAISAMEDGDTTQWVLVDNTIHTVTKAELKEALRLAGVAMTTIWMQPYLP